MDPYLRDVLDVLLRMLHVVAGIAWIGASFYFVRLDLALRAPKRREDADAGVAGEFWGVHGGGLYHSQKYRLAPAEMPEPLHWFKWEAYTTWLSGFALMVVLYYFDAGCPARRRGRRRPRRVAGDRAQRRRHRARVDRLRRPLPNRRAAKPGRARRSRHGARRARGVGRERAVRAACRLPPGRRDARDDHGRERLLRDHPGAPQARHGDGGEARARRRAAPRGQEPLGAQQLPHAARALHDARGALRVRLRRGRGVARLRRHRGADGADPRLLQPLAHGAARVVDPGGRGRRRRRARVLAAARGGRVGRQRAGRVRADPAGDRRALRDVSLGRVARRSESGWRRRRRSRRASTTSSARRCSPRRCRPETRPG